MYVFKILYTINYQHFINKQSIATVDSQYTILDKYYNEEFIKWRKIIVFKELLYPYYSHSNFHQFSAADSDCSSA